MKIEILGKPIPLARPRATTRGFYDPQYTAKKNFASYVKENIYLTETIKSPIHLELEFYFRMPKSWSKKKQKQYYDDPRHAQKADLDNLIKFILDSLNEIVWQDDAQIWSIQASKNWTDKEDKTIIKVYYDKNKN